MMARQMHRIGRHKDRVLSLVSHSVHVNTTQHGAWMHSEWAGCKREEGSRKEVKLGGHRWHG